MPHSFIIFFLLLLFVRSSSHSLRVRIFFFFFLSIPLLFFFRALHSIILFSLRLFPFGEIFHLVADQINRVGLSTKDSHRDYA